MVIVFNCVVKVLMDHKFAHCEPLLFDRVGFIDGILSQNDRVFLFLSVLTIQNEETIQLYIILYKIMQFYCTVLWNTWFWSQQIGALLPLLKLSLLSKCKFPTAGLLNSCLLIRFFFSVLPIFPESALIWCLLYYSTSPTGAILLVKLRTENFIVNTTVMQLQCSSYW